jgi:predicted Zn-dependent peptidase
LRLVYEPHPSNIPQTHIRAFCHVGSIHEPDNIRGASHFIEHMCFKGSCSFPSWSAVNEPFSSSGSNFNATTTKQYTCFIVDCLDSYVSKFLTILGDMMLRSKFDRKEYNIELNVVREETAMKLPDSFIENLAFKGTVYENWVDHNSYHKPGCLPYDDVIKFYHQYYKPNNIVLSVVSSISFNTILRYISSTSFIRHHSRCGNTKINTSPIQNHNIGALESNCNSNHMIIPSKSKTTHIEIGVRVCDQTSDDVYVLDVLRHIISESMSSRLFVELREKRGLTYRSGSYMTLYENGGIFVLYAKSDVSRLLKDGKKTRSKLRHIDRRKTRTHTQSYNHSKPGVLPVILNILDDLIKNGIKDSELKMAKQHIKESLKMNSIAGGDKSHYNGIRMMLHNETDITPNEEVFSTFYKSITKSDVNAIIHKYFASRNYYFSAIGGKLPKSSMLVELLL